MIIIKLAIPSRISINKTTQFKTTLLKKISIKIVFIVILAVSMIGLCYLGLSFLISAYSASINFNGYFADGAFQLYDPLRRLGAGQVPGRDFDFFHGLGTLYIHYPLYVLFGKNLFASELSRWTVSPATFFITTFIFIFFICRKYGISLFFTLVSVVLSITYYSILVYPANSSFGVRTAMPIVIASILIALGYANNSDKYRYLVKFPIYNCLIALLLSLAFFFSVEHGLYALIAYFLVDLFYISNDESIIYRIGKIIFTSILYILFTISIYISVSGSNFIEPIKYALVDIPGDQFWYFSSVPGIFYNPITRIFSDNVVVTASVIALMFLFITILLYRRERKFEFAAILFLLIYALFTNISLLGAANHGYTTPMYRIDTLVAIWFIIRVIPSYVINSSKYGNNPTYLNLYFLTIFILSILLMCQLQFPDVTGQLNDLTIADQNHNNEEQISGTYLSPAWSAHLNAFYNISGIFRAYDISNADWENGINKQTSGFAIRYDKNIFDNLMIGDKVKFEKSGIRNITMISQIDRMIIIHVDGPLLDPKGDGYPNYLQIDYNDNGFIDNINSTNIIWSVYSSIIEDDLGVYNPSRDYIIHALGPSNRADYIDKLNAIKPAFVRTDNKQAWIFGEWLINCNWDFYEAVFSNYKLVYKDNYGAFWERTNNHWTENTAWDGNLTNLSNDQTIEIPLNRTTSAKQILVINATYEISNPWSKIPIIGNIPRYYLIPENTYSTYWAPLVPYQNSISFPLYLCSDDNPILKLKTSPQLPGVTFKIDGIKYRYLNVSENTTEYLFDVNQYYVNPNYVTAG